MANSVAPEPTVTRKDTITIGRPSTAHIGTLVQITVAGTPYSFVEVDGKLYNPCHRCGDFTGKLWQHNNVMGGVCMLCGGFGRERTARTVADATRLARSRWSAAQRRERARQAEIAAVHATRVAEYAAWTAANPDLLAQLKTLGERAQAGDNGIDQAVQQYAETVTHGHALTASETENVQHLLAQHAAAEARKATARYAAPVGDKVTVTGRIVVRKAVDTAYGTSMLLVIEGTGTDTGITAKTFGTGETLWGWKDYDGEVTITGRVKGHDTYRDVAQTVLTRSTVKEVKQQAAPSDEASPAKPAATSTLNADAGTDTMAAQLKDAASDLEAINNDNLELQRRFEAQGWAGLDCLAGTQAQIHGIGGGLELVAERIGVGGQIVRDALLNNQMITHASKASLGHG